MRTIYFDDKDIKESKIALVNQKITPLQSAFLMQYITNIEEQLQQKEDIINKIKKYLRENEKEYGSLEDNEKIILRILDNKGE